jgi:Flp pilus assembly pilin Flp
VSTTSRAIHFFRVLFLVGSSRADEGPPDAVPQGYIGGEVPRRNQRGGHGRQAMWAGVSTIGLRDSPCLPVTLHAREILMFRKFRTDQRGTSAIEYCLLATFLSLAIIAGARSIGSNISTNMYGPIAGNLN